MTLRNYNCQDSTRSRHILSIQSVLHRRRCERKIDELQGVKPSGDSGSDECEILEMHIDLDIPGFEDVDAEGDETGIKLPYIVTLLPRQSTILSIQKLQQNDPMRRRVDYFVHYKFLRVGFYGFGLTHMIGGLSEVLPQYSDS